MSVNENVQVVLRVIISLKENVSVASRRPSKENVSAASHRPFERKRVSRFASDPFSFSKYRIQICQVFFEVLRFEFRVVHLFADIDNSFEIIHNFEESVEFEI